MIGVLITIIIVGLLVGLAYWVADAIPIPQPLNKFVKIGCMVVGCIVIILALASLAGYDTGLPLLRR